jgi:hypothetical protein
LPEASRLKLEILQELIEGKPRLGPLFPPCEVKPIEGEGGLCAEIFPKEEKYRSCGACVGLEKKRGDLIVGLAFFRYVDGQRSKLLLLRDRERDLRTDQRLLKAMQLAKEQYTKEQLDGMTEKLQQTEDEVNALKAMNKKAALQYRVYLPLENYQLELFSTKAPPRTDAPR